MTAETGSAIDVVVSSAEEAKRAVREVLERFGLYRRRRLVFADEYETSYAPWPSALTLRCECSKGEATTWSRVGQATEPYSYQCVLCGESQVNIYAVSEQRRRESPAGLKPAKLAALASFEMWKVGQWPSPSVYPGKLVRRALDPEMQDSTEKA